MKKQPRARVAQLLPEVRTERLIAIGRLLLGVCGLFAVAIDPPDPSNARSATIILLMYSAYAAVLLLALRFAHAHVPRHRLLIHLLDLAVFALLVIFTGRTSSPFFSPVLFPIVAATLRWQESGAIRTGAAVLVFFLGIHLYDTSVGSVVLNTALVRYAFLVAVTLLLAEMGQLDRKRGLHVMRIARWPHMRGMDRPTIAGEVLTRAAGAFNAPRALLAWEDPEEPWVDLFSWDATGLSRVRLPDGTGEPLVHPPVSGAPFLWTRSRTGGSVLYLAGDRPQLHRGAPCAPSLSQHLSSRTTIGLPLRGKHAEGYLFLGDAPDITADDLRLGEVLARQVSESLQQFVLLEQLRTMTVAEERVRVSRDLHDGVLQTLTGIALQLATVRQLVTSSPEQARDQLRDLEQLILEEQRDLRFFTVELRLRSGLETDGVLFPQALGGLLGRVQKVWGISVAWDPQEAQLVPPSLAWETYQLVHEGLVNAARHGHARKTSVHFSTAAGQLRVSLHDDGAGFPFEGRFSLADLVSQKRGPRSLRERVQALAGGMQIESSSAGAKIDISLPVERART